MDFVEVIKQARTLLQSEGRMTYRTLKRQFGLDDEALEDLKDEFIYAKREATDEGGPHKTCAAATQRQHPVFRSETRR